MNHRHLDLPMFMGAGLSFVIFFSKSFSAIYFWKKYLLVTPNLLSSALEMILTFFMNDRIFFFVFWFGRRTWLLACRRGIFFVFPLFFFDFFFFPFYGVSTASGLGWTVSTEITTFVLLDDPSKSLFLCYLILYLCLCILYRSIYHQNYKWTIIDIFFRDVSDMI